MFRQPSSSITYGGLCLVTLLLTGCASFGHSRPGWGWGKNKSCDSGMCQTGCDTEGCGTCGSKKFKLGKSKDKCDTCEVDGGKEGHGFCNDCGKKGKLKGGCCLGGCLVHRSLAIQDAYPIGSLERAHFHQMQTNAEAADFILYQKDFVLETAELTPDGKDKILEIAARMRSAPFPVVIERSWNNSNPELDAFRRSLVAQVLTDLGNGDANNRTFVSPAYGFGKHSLEASPEFYQFTFSGSQNNFGGNGNGNGGGGFGGGGGGGFGGGGGGGGGFGN